MLLRFVVLITGLASIVSCVWVADSARRDKRMLRSVLLWVLESLPGVFVSAAEPEQSINCVAGERTSADRPDALGTSTVVRLGISVMDVLSIDDLNQSVELDLIVYIEWTDPRLTSLPGIVLVRMVRL